MIQILEIMEEFPKTYCLYHPAESITNFCKEKSCLMPLCPTCICSHLDLHIKEGKSIPQFDNITDSLTNTYKEIRVFGEKFEESRIKLNSIQRSINDKKKEFIDLIYNTKIQMRELVDSSFAELEKDLEAAIFKQNSSIGMHLPEHINEIEKRLIDLSSRLRDMMGDLKGEASLGTLITYCHEGRASIEKNSLEINRLIKNNEEYFPVTTLNHQAVNRIRQGLTQIINLRFNFPQPMTSKLQLSERDNNLIGVNEGSKMISGIQTPRSPLSKIGNGQVVSPNSRISHQKMASPMRYKSVLQAPTSPRLSAEGLPLYSQLNSKVKQEN